MATKKTTKKSTKKSTKKDETIKLTYKPVDGGSTAKQLTFQLRKKEFQEINGRQMERNVPLIEGLPMRLTVEKDQILEVTPEQYELLVDMKCVESEKEYKARQEFVDNLGRQHPQKLKYEEIDQDYVNGASARQFEKFYADKLIRV